MNTIRLVVVVLLIELPTSFGQERRTIRNMVAVVCRRRPELVYCGRLAGKGSVERRVPERMIESLREQPVSLRRANSGDYCARWRRHFSHYCIDLLDTHKRGVAEFCPVYAKVCNPENNQQTFERAASSIQEYCQRNSPFARAYCVQGATGEAAKRCQEYIARCSPRQPPSSAGTGGVQVQQLCTQYRELAERYCSHGVQLPAPYDSYCQLYRENCKGSGGAAPARTATAPASPFREQDPLYNQENANALFGQPGQPGLIGQPQPSSVASARHPLCVQYESLAQQYCFSGIPLPGQYESYCELYRTHCVGGSSSGGLNPSSIPSNPNPRPFGGFPSGGRVAGSNPSGFQPVGVGTGSNVGVGGIPIIDTGRSVNVDPFGGGVSTSDAVNLPFLGLGIDNPTNVGFPGVNQFLGG